MYFLKYFFEFIIWQNWLLKNNDIVTRPWPDNYHKEEYIRNSSYANFEPYELMKTDKYWIPSSTY